MNEILIPTCPILIIDDEEEILMSIDTILHMAGFNNIITCKDSRDALHCLRQRSAEMVLTDLYMPHIEGEAILNLVNQESPEIPVVIVTSESNAQTAVRCMKAGATDYLVKPIEEDRLISVVRNTVALREVRRENLALKNRILSRSLETPEAFLPIVTQDPQVVSLFQYIESIGPTSQPVLITGETGVGKELFAQSVHACSGRSGNFVAVNAAGLDDAVFSDTLFGHVRGAYTGASQQRAGLIEQAAGGTLFLDEIGDLTAGSQIKLLRLLQEKEYLPLGADTPKKTSARIVAATNVNLIEHEAAGRFRKDLFFRLKPHQIHIPPLRERLEDLPLLVNHFLQKTSRELNKNQPTAPKELVALLRTYSFPGNIRELEGIIYDAVSRHKSKMLSLEVFKKHLQDNRGPMIALTDSPPLESQTIIFPKELPSIKESADLLVEEAMRRANGIQSIAAQMLGMSHQALSKRLKLKGRKPQKKS